MKYIKFLEDYWEDAEKDADKLLRNKPYWRYRNSTIDSIIKIEYLPNNYYDFTILHINTNEIEKNIFNEFHIGGMIINNDQNKILRPATK